MRISIFRHIVFLSGTGVGGGSLVYANTLPVPKSTFYSSGSWSKLANWQAELKPFYQTALKMLGAARNTKLFDADLKLKELAYNLGKEDKFELPNVAVFFGTEDVEVKDPYFNGRGPSRTGCNFCGGCMTGCRHNAKNTLDKNYLYLAQNLGAEILAEHEVKNVVPLNGQDGSSGYSVSLTTSTKLFKQKKKFTAKGVIFSGGTLGTVSLLLKIKEKSLPRLSDRLGYDIRTNNETLISVSTMDKDKDLSKGVAIGSLLHTDDNSHLEIVRYSAGSDFWKLLHLPYVTGKNVLLRLIKIFVAILQTPWKYFKIYFVNSWAKSTAVLLFMQTLDSTLKFKKNIFGKIVSVVNTGKKPSPFIPESIELTKQYAKIINGKATSFSIETLAGIPNTAHILGGAVMGIDKSQGVINKNNEVFDYQNMLVIDGSMISSNPGVNPSLSITAIAERAMHQIPNKDQSQ